MDQAAALIAEKEVKASKSFSEPEVSFKPPARRVGKSEGESVTSPKGSKNSDSVQSCEAAVISSANEADEWTAEGERWYELLETRIGLDINDKAWIKAHPELAYKSKSELMLRLAYELCLAENTYYNPKNDRVDNEKENNKYTIFDANRIFALFAVANDLMEQSDRKNFVRVVCQKNNVQLLEMIFLQEKYEKKEQFRLQFQYPWKGNFTGYIKPIDLLQEAIDNRYSSEIVLCIAKKLYGTLHSIYNGTQYIEDSRVRKIQTMINQPSSLMKECLKKAAKFGYKSAVLVVLGGDIYHCFRLMKYKRFKEKTEFIEAYNMIKEAVADVISSWVKNMTLKTFFKDNVQRLLNQGIKMDINKMSKLDLEDELNVLGREVGAGFSKRELIKMLVEEADQEVAGNIMLRKTVVGAFISVLFFEHQGIAMEDKEQGCFPFDVSSTEYKKRKTCEQLNNKINNGASVEDIVLRLIKLLNSRSHISYGWFFREVLAKIMNDKEKFSKLRAVCTAVCKKPMQELLKGVEVNEEVMNVLKFIGVDKDSLVLENSGQCVTTVLDKSDVALSSIPTNISLLQMEVPVNSSSISEMGTSNMFSTSNIASSRQSIADARQTFNDFPLTSCGLQKISITGPVNQDIKATLQDKFTVDAELEKARQQSLVAMPSTSSLPAASKRRHSESNLSDSSLADRDKENSMLSGKILNKSGKKKEASTELLTSELLGQVCMQMIPSPPSIQQLLDADRKTYMQKVFDKVLFDYNTLSYNGLYGRILLDQSQEEMCNEERKELNELFGSTSNFIKYENAVSKLMNGDKVAAKRMLLKQTNEFVNPACYAHVLLFFQKIIRQCDILNTAEENVKIMEENKDTIKIAVQILNHASHMEPANSFLIGMMKRYNIGGCSQFMNGSWKEDLIYVVNVTRNYHSCKIEQHVLSYIDSNKGWGYERCGLGMIKKDERLKEICKYSLYEITLSVSSEQYFNADILNKLFQFLFKDKFPEAFYSYGAALLQNKVGTTFKENIKDAMVYLNLAASAGHEGAKFLLGILPFNKKVSCMLKQDEIKSCIRGLEDYIDSSDGSCSINEKNIDKVVHCLAVEYYAKKSLLGVQHNKQKAEKILRSRKLCKELHYLQYQVRPSSTQCNGSIISPSYTEQTFYPMF